MAEPQSSNVITEDPNTGEPRYALSFTRFEVPLIESILIFVNETLNINLDKASAEFKHRNKAIKKWLNIEGNTIPKEKEQYVFNTIKTFLAHVACENTVDNKFLINCKTFLKPWRELHSMSEVPKNIRMMLYEMCKEAQIINESKKVSTPLRRKTKPTQQTILFMDRLTRPIRIYIVSVFLWFLYVTIRTANDFEFLGIDFRRWDRGSYEMNMFLPPCLILGSWLIYKWIKKGN
ncbi:MAG: hypothetical protein HQK81_05145 [Desulfovibrionaceae bacterium]|nr:hypothetical protein [Desulfovibrionaceae bacterium]MBF0513432.1 hypothetical protein [Desulfovibrionaceae bacterium]